MKASAAVVALCAVILVACSENPPSTQGGAPAIPSQQGDPANSLPTANPPSRTEVIPRTEPKPGIVATCDPGAPERRAGMRVVLVCFHCALPGLVRGIKRFP